MFKVQKCCLMKTFVLSRPYMWENASSINNYCERLLKNAQKTVLQWAATVSECHYVICDLHSNYIFHYHFQVGLKLDYQAFTCFGRHRHTADQIVLIKLPLEASRL